MEKISLKTVMLRLKALLIRLSAVLSYSFLGAVVFYFIEQSNEEHPQTKTNFTSALSSIKWRLHENTSRAELHQLSRELYNLANTVNEKNQIKMDTTDEYFTWVYFCLTTMMTIGYGDITPKTNEGKLFLIIYGAPGIALMIILLAFSAQLQTSLIQMLVKKMNRFKKRPNSNSGISKHDDLRVFILSLFFLIPVEIIGVLSVWRRTNWSAIDCLYFWFCTVTTIGFGDLVVSHHKPSNIVPWLLMKTLTLATMAGVVNSLAVILQKRKKIKLRRHKKRCVDNGNDIELS